MNPSQINLSQFMTKQYFDAIAPENFLFTNPEVIKTTINTGGLNLLYGFNQFLQDFNPNTGQLDITRCNENAFRVGENIAMTKGDVVFKNDMIELIHYTPTTSKVHAIPLLMIPPWINKYYILDLSPHNSLVAALVAQGISVYMISWVNPNATYAHKGLWDYMHEGPICAIKFIQQHSEKVNALGFCLGGTLLAMLNSYYQSIGNNPINSATYLATLIDFSELGDIAVYLNPQFLICLEQQIKLQGYLSGKTLSFAFSSLRAKDLIWSCMVKNYLQGLSPKPLDFLYWNADSTNLPATMYLEYLHWLLLNNQLIKPNQIILNNIPLNIQSINNPSWWVATKNDHIAPWQTVYKGFKLLGGNKQFILGGAGHIAGIINPTTKYGYNIGNEYSDSADQWLENSTAQSGSWWPAWFLWLKKLSGKKISPQQHSQVLLRSPGDYVLTSVLTGDLVKKTTI